MAYGDKGNFPTRTKSGLDDLKWRLYGEKLEGGKSRPTFSFHQKMNGNPRIEVWLNNGAEGDKGRIQLDLDPWAAETVFEMIKKVADAREEIKLKLDVMVSFMYGKKLDKPEVKGSIIVGRSSDRRIYIGVVERNKPAVRFFFESPTWFRMSDSDGNDLRPELQDELWARAWVNGVSRIWSILFERNWKEPERDNNKGNGGNKGGYGNNNGYNNNRQEEKSFDESFDDNW